MHWRVPLLDVAASFVLTARHGRITEREQSHTSIKRALSRRFFGRICKCSEPLPT